MKKDKYGPQTEEDIIAEKWLKQYSEGISNNNRIKKGGTEANPNEPLKYVIYAGKSSED